MLMARTSTPGIAAPEGSVTRPVTVAVGLAISTLASKTVAARTRIDEPRFIEVCSRRRRIVSRMIGTFVEECGREEDLARGLLAATGRFDGDEDLVDLLEHIGLLELHDPALLRGVIHVEDAEAACRLRAAVLLAPHLEGDFVDVALVLQVIGVEDQRPSLRIEDASGKGPLLTRSAGVQHIDHFQVPRSHQVPYVFARG